MNEQFGALLETLEAIRTERFPDVPAGLVEAVLSEHVDDPNGPSLHRKIEALLEEAAAGWGDHALD